MMKTTVYCPVDVPSDIKSEFDRWLASAAAAHPRNRVFADPVQWVHDDGRVLRRFDLFEVEDSLVG